MYFTLYMCCNRRRVTSNNCYKHYKFAGGIGVSATLRLTAKIAVELDGYCLSKRIVGNNHRAIRIIRA